MDKIAVWVAPLVLLPGVASLVLSTAQRFSRVHEEFHRLLADPPGHAADRAGELLRRATLFRNAMVSFYISIGLLALASMVGGLSSLGFERGFWAAHALTGAGVAAVLYGTTQLIRESFRSMTMIKTHHDQVVRRQRDAG